MSGVVGPLNECSGLTDKSLASGNGNDGVGLTTLATGDVLASVGHICVDGERLARDGGLVNSDLEHANTRFDATIIIVLGPLGTPDRS